ncbi:hypothetical protein [Legionella clemsonensis]|uniref:Uncharacterized protein n=1 Tax=Legionella clemsonensis TaxID=1867846 RepID=A0A222P6G0_9GAMM|nr:hypothetical protein [Legionella clemsonensis]ASQ47423.1 hypothetical protein clem_14485 [Legionella clemsonensis]
MKPDQLPPLVVLSSTTTEHIDCCDSEGKLLLTDSHKPILYVPTLLVQQELITPDYVLYLLDNDENLSAKLENIENSEQNAIVLVGTQRDRKAYFIEKGKLISPYPVELSCGYSLEKMKELHPTESGKVNPADNNKNTLATVIRYLRLNGDRANEVEITGTRTGKNVFSMSFGPCNPIVGQRKNDKQFVLNHADGSGVDREGGIGKFLKSIEEGGGADFIAVMQNPKVARSMAKAPIIAGGLAVELKKSNILRINFPEGYNAIACINGDTIILTKNMQFFKTIEEKQELLHKFSSASAAEKSREIEMHDDKQVIDLSGSIEEIERVNQQLKKSTLKKKGPYDAILQGLQSLGIEKPKKEGFFRSFLKF